MDASALGLKIKNKEISIKEAIDLCAENIAQKEANINALITPMVQLAYKRAEDIQASLDNYQSLLVGVPFVAKDNICLKNERTTCASNMLKEYVPPYTATALEQLIDSGAVCLGKANMDEFAFGATGETSYFGKTLNPVDLSRVPGGSSSGSAAAVASGEAFFALGSDSGGSVRLPAAYCGLVGLLPTYGTVSRYGLVAHASSMDQIGPITKSVRDSVNVMNLMAGQDKADATSVAVNCNYHTNESIKGMKVAISEELMEYADEAIKEKIYEAVRELEKKGVVVKNEDLISLKECASVYSILACAEASSNLARYDGIKYGGFSGISGDTDSVCKKTRQIGFGDEVKRRIFFGSYVLSDGYEKYFLPAQRMRREYYRMLERLFKEYDAILLPVSKSVAPLFNENFSSAKEINATDIYTVIANLAQIPAISVPFGAIDGLPVGVQLIGDRFKENTLFALGEALERKNVSSL